MFVYILHADSLLRQRQATINLTLLSHTYSVNFSGVTEFPYLSQRRNAYTHFTNLF